MAGQPEVTEVTVTWQIRLGPGDRRGSLALAGGAAAAAALGAGTRNQIIAMPGPGHQCCPPAA